MSVLIDGMEMPKTCCGCVFSSYTPTGRIPYCKRTGENLTADVYFNKRDSSCPLIEVSEPHGRLIDADAFIEKCEEMADKEDGNQLDALVLLRWFLEQNAPTIIPADPAEED